MSREEYTWVVCYDISKDSHRNKVSDYLEEHGTRVQFSVFELHMPDTQMHNILSELKSFIDPRDSIRVYALNNQTRSLSITYGNTPDICDGGYWIV